MKIRLTIARKIYFGFGVLAISAGLIFVLTNQTLNDNEKVAQDINDQKTPTLKEINKLSEAIHNTKMLAKRWVDVQSDTAQEDKVRLKEYVQNDIPASLLKLDVLSAQWEKRDKIIFDSMNVQIRSFLKSVRVIMNELDDFNNYDNPMVMFSVRPMVENGGEINLIGDEIINEIDLLSSHHNLLLLDANAKMIASFEQTKTVIITFGIPVIFAGLLIAFFTVRSFVDPILKLKNTLLVMAKGVLPESEGFSKRDDEIGEIARALNDHKSGLKRTIEFTEKVGGGDFTVSHTPSSDEDILGHTLLKMKDDLQQLTEGLETKVRERTEEVVKQKETIEEKNKAIMDSIRYALTIQRAILPPTELLRDRIADLFILYKPRDIVSGDFYWFHEFNENEFLIAAVDCTGHGIPGAFMSMIGVNLLNRIISEGYHEPHEILAQLHNQIQAVLKQKNTGNTDGMDMSICLVNKAEKRVKYSGAKNPLIMVKDNEMIKIKASRHPIGGAEQKPDLTYEAHEFVADTPTAFYIFSDGYADQFGGEKGKKLYMKNYLNLLTESSSMNVNDQKEYLDTFIENWKGKFPQIDDILVMGFRL